MGFRGEQIAVGTTPVELTQFAESDTIAGRSLAITSATVDIFLGADNTVSTSTGAKLPVTAAIGIDLARGDHVWAVAASSGIAHVVEAGV